MLDIEINGVLPKGTTNRQICQIVASSLKVLKVTSYSLEIDFVSKQKMRKVNKSYRSTDASTDVLSFPQTKIPGQKVRILGNIIIAPDIVQEENEEIDNVIKHGLLHLLGYDHELNNKEWGIAARKINCNFKGEDD